MTDVALWHRLYTHAAGDARWETTGGRFVDDLERDASRILPEEVRLDLDQLLKKVVPSGEGAGYAVRRYSGGSDVFACVITSYGGLVSDAGGRRGLLTHARVVKVPANEALFDVAALVEAAESFPLEDLARIPAEERFAEYRNLVAAEPEVTIPPVSIRELQELPRTFLCALLLACLSGHGRKERKRYALPRPEEGTLAAAVARGWSALPVGLQRGSSWAVEVEDGAPVDAVFSVHEGQPPEAGAAPQLAETVKRYVNALLDGPHDFRAILRNPEIRSVAHLTDAVQRLGRVDMKKGRGNEPPAPAGATGGATDGDLAAELDRQFRAMELSLKSYIDQRITAIDSQRQTRAAAAPIEETVYDEPRPRIVPASAPVNWKPFLIGGVLFALLASGGLWMYLRKPPAEQFQQDTPPSATTADVVPTDTGEPPAPPADLRRDTLRNLIASASADGKWADSFKDLIEKHSRIAGASLRTAADGDDVDGDVVTPAARDTLNEYATRIDASEALTPSDRTVIRELLLEYIAARVAAAELPSARVSVDGNLRDVTPALLALLKTRHGVTLRATDKDNRELQSEIILRWMESSPR